MLHGRPSHWRGSCTSRALRPSMWRDRHTRTHVHKESPRVLARPAVGRHAREQSIHTECDLACGAPAPEGLSLWGASMRDLPSVHTSSIRAVRLGAVAALLLGVGVGIGAAQQGTGSISGRVLDPTTKRRLAGA